MLGTDQDLNLTNRTVIPYWHGFTRIATDARQLLPAVAKRRSVPALVSKDTIAERVAAWEGNKNLTHALDLIGFSLSIEDPSIARAAAVFALESKHRLPAVVRRTAESALRSKATEDSTLLSHFPTLHTHDAESVRRLIQTLKKNIRLFPKAPYYWVELARAYIILNCNEQAKRAMNVALLLAPNDRFVIRCAVCMHDHLGNLEQALSMLRKRKHQVTSDPWLLSAEISAMRKIEKRSRLIKKGVGFIESIGKFAPYHVSELAACVATEESHAGSHKKAKKIFAQAANDPTDNAAAQISWAIGNSFLPNEFWGRQMDLVSEDYEAEYIHNRQKLKWSNALASVEAWRATHPYSNKAAFNLVTVAVSLVEDFDKAEEMCLHMVNRGNRAFENNLAYAYLRQGKVREAREILDKAVLSDPDKKATIAATRGMLCYRSHNAAEGEKFYEVAVKHFKATRNYGSVSNACRNWAREVFREGGGHWNNLLREAEKYAKKSSGFLNEHGEEIALAKKLREDIKNNEHTPTKVK